jgi:hypothetical protein
MSVQAVEGLKPGKDEWTGNTTIEELSNRRINPQTSASPAVANFADSLLFTWRASTNDKIYQCLYNNGAWSQDTWITVGGTVIGTSDGPSLAVFNDTLYMAYRSSAEIDGEYPIMLSTLASGLTDPSQWQGTAALSINGENLPTDHAPSLTVQGTGSTARLWLGWQKDSDLFTATFDGTSWTNNGQIQDVESNGTPASNYGPALCGYGNSVWVIFKGRHSNNLMWAAYNAVTELWSGNLDIEDKRGIMDKPKSNRPPGIAVFDGSMYITYKGDDDNDIRQAMLTDQAWSGNKPIYDSSDIDPVTDTTTGMTSAVQGTKTVLIMANKGVGTSGAGIQIYVSELK